MLNMWRAVEHQWASAVRGVVAVIFGILVLVPGPALALIWLIAPYAVVFGVLLIILAFRLRGLGQHQPFRTTA